MRKDALDTARRQRTHPLLMAALTAGLFAGCAAPHATPPRFSFEVANDGSATVQGVGNASAAGRTVSRDFEVPPGATGRIALEPPAPRFDFAAVIHAAAGGPTARASATIDLDACAGRTVFRFSATAEAAGVAVGKTQTRCE